MNPNLALRTSQVSAFLSMVSSFPLVRPFGWCMDMPLTSYTDRTKRLYKSSTLALGLSNPALSINGEPVDYSRSRSVSMSTSWEEEIERQCFACLR